MTAAERMQQYRQRRREGRVIVPLVVNAEGVEDLVGLGWLRPSAAPGEVRAAVLRLLEPISSGGCGREGDA